MNNFIAASRANNRALTNNAVERDVVTSFSACLVARPAHVGPAAAGGPPVAAVAAAAAGAAAAGAVAAAAQAAAVAAAAGAGAVAINGVAAEVGGEPALNPPAAAAAAVSAVGGRRPAPTCAFDVLVPGVRHAQLRPSVRAPAARKRNFGVPLVTQTKSCDLLVHTRLSAIII